jgi:hypothetical protein
MFAASLKSDRSINFRIILNTCECFYQSDPGSRVQGIAKYSLDLNGGNATSTLVSATPTLLPAQVRHWLRFPE